MMRYSPPPLRLFLIVLMFNINQNQVKVFGYLGGFNSLQHMQNKVRDSFSIASSAKKDDIERGDSTKYSSLEVTTTQIRLSNETPLAEIMTCLPLKRTKSNPKAPLIFIHGSFHASWCWAEHYFSYFASAGYPCYALSLRGTGGTPAGEGITKVKIDDHVDDLSAFIRYVLRAEEEAAGGRGVVSDPVLVGHSFGGLTLMKYFERRFLNAKNCDGSTDNHDFPPLPQIGGVALLCSVPPSGNGKMTLRFLRRSLVDSYKITVGLAAKKCITNAKLCRDLFFDGQKGNGIDEDLIDDFGVSDADLKRYQSYFLRDTVATIDIADLSKKLPSAHVVPVKEAGTGRAVFADRMPPALVVGAKHDFIVDNQGVLETAQYFGIGESITMVDSPHDVMLGRNWEEGASAIRGWLERIRK